MGNLKRTACYLRVSTSRQAEEGDSIPAQRDALRKYINEHNNMVFVGEYLDDGISGTKEDRDAYQHLLSDIQSDKIDLVLITKLDRIHRGLRNFLTMQEIMEKHSCSWLAIWEPMYDSSTPQGKMIINTMVNLAQFEAENTGQRIRQVFEYKRSQGEVTNGKMPYGYQIVNKHLVPNEDAPNAVSIFEYFAKTGALSDTMRYASELGHSVTRRGLKLSLLSNPVYIGARGAVPIIDRSLWDRVQAGLVRGIRNNAKRIYVFSGLLVCAECGCRTVSESRTAPNGKVHPMYRCQKKYHRGIAECVNTRTIYEKTLENLLLDRIPDMIEEKQREMREEAKRTPDPAKKIERLRKKIERLKDLYLAEELTMEEYKSDKAKLIAELENLESQKPAPDYSKTITLFTSDLPDRYWTWDPESRRAFWRGIIKEIRFDKDRNMTVEFLE